MLLLNWHAAAAAAETLAISRVAAKPDSIEILFVSPPSSNSFLILKSPNLVNPQWSLVSGVTVTALGGGQFLARLPKAAVPMEFYKVANVITGPDLVGWFGAVSFPTDLVKGIGASGSAALVALNHGDRPLPGLQSPAILVVARPVAGGPDMPLLNLQNQLSANLAEGHFQTLNFNFVFPTNLAAGNYRVVAILDSSNSVAEMFEDNNQVVDPVVRQVQLPFVDVFTKIKLTSLAASLLAGDVGSVTLTLGNNGNVIASGQIDLEIFASKDTVLGPEDTLLGRVTNYVVVLPPRKATDLALKIQFPMDIQGDQYHLIARVTPHESIPDSNSANNVDSDPDLYDVWQKFGLDDFRRYNAPGLSWDYECFVTNRVSGAFGNASASDAFIMNVRVEGLLTNSGGATRIITSRAGKTLATADWQIGTNGAVLIRQSSANGITDVNAVVGGLDVAPEFFDPLSGSSFVTIGRFSGSVTNHDPGLPDLVSIEGEIRSGFRLLGYEDVVLQSGVRFEKAFKYDLTLCLTSVVSIVVTGAPVHVDYIINTEVKGWAVLGTGAVKTESRTVVIAHKTGADTGTIETIAVAELAAPNGNLASALDAPWLVWLTPTNSGWHSQNVITHGGANAAQSRAVPDNGKTAMQTTVVGPGEINFWWKVSSEENYDFVRFNVDGNEEASLSGLVDWAQVSFLVPEGQHILEWVYAKDEAVDDGDDTAWVDQVTWQPEKGINFEDFRMYNAVGTSWDYESSTSTEFYGAFGSFTASDFYMINVRIEALATTSGGATRVITSRAGKDLGSTEWQVDTNGTKLVGQATFGDAMNFDFDIMPLLVAPPVVYPKSGRVYLGASAFEAWITNRQSEGTYVIKALGLTEANLRLLGYQDVILQSGMRFDKALKFELSISSTSTLYLVIEGNPIALGEYAVSEVQTTWAASGAGIVKSSSQILVAVSQSGGSPVGAIKTSSIIELASPRTSLAEALDAVSLAWLTPVAVGWKAQTNTSFTHDGVDSAQSDPILANQKTSMQTSVTGPGEGSFWWRVSSQADHDFLRFKLDGAEQNSNSGQIGWINQTFFVPDGRHALEWMYEKDEAGSAGFDRGWVDQVVFHPDTGPPWVQTQPQIARVIESFPTQFQVVGRGLFPLSYQWEKNLVPLSGATNSTLSITNAQLSDSGNYRVVIRNAQGSTNSQTAVLTVTPLVPLDNAVDLPALTWSTSGRKSWIGQTEVTHDGADAAQSGSHFEGGGSFLETHVTGPGTVNFFWKVSTDPDGYDYLRFSVGGIKYAQIHGETAWQSQSFFVPAGAQLLQWMYWKDNDGRSLGADAGWVDQVSFVPDSGPPVILTQPQSLMVTQGMQTFFNVSVRGRWPFTYQWQKNGTNIVGATNDNLTISNVQSSAAGNYRVRIDNSFGSVLSSNANLIVISSFTLQDALDTVGLNWNTGGQLPWTPQTNTTHDLVDAAQSGHVSNGQSSFLETTVMGPGQISFWWKVSSETSFDFLRFSSNSVTVDQISGEVNWRSNSFTVLAGSHTLRWTYDKDSSDSQGQDAGWVDQVRFQPTGASAFSPNVGER